MGTTTAILFLTLMLNPCEVAPAPNAEQDVRRLERSWLDAYEKHDVAAMRAIVADDFAITFPDGSTQNKSQVVDSVKTPVAPGTPSTKFSTTDVKARVYGETVILTGHLLSEYGRDAERVREHYRYTDTYVRRDGRWQAVASHLSKAPPVQQPSAAISFNAGAGRSLHGNKVLSLQRPFVKIDVDERLPHTGTLNFRLKDVTQVERYIYAHADKDRRVERLLIIQFESILPGVQGSYSFPVTNPTRIGTYDYETSVGFFNFAERVAANPGAEADHTKTLLEKNGLNVDDELLVARYARITDDDKRSELIFFYLENPRAFGLSAADLKEGGSRFADAERVFADFTVRALKSFKVADRKP
jgi:ketosteroid isomerase-like protein